MDKQRYDEMVSNIDLCKDSLKDRKAFLFGHCEATLTLADLLFENNITPVAILDNNEAKYGKNYKGIPIVSPNAILDSEQNKSTVLIVSRFYESMNTQLRKLGFIGAVVKLVDYNTYAEYSFSVETIVKKWKRVNHGQEIIEDLKKKYENAYIIFCPFNALGDIYFTMSYLPAFLKKRKENNFVVIVPEKGCAAVAGLFGVENIEVMEQNELDAAIQAVIYTQNNRCFISHQDRPYVVDLHKILKFRKIPLEKIYCCGVFGLSPDTIPIKPMYWNEWTGNNKIEPTKTVILSPYAKSVPTLPYEIWTDIVLDYWAQGYHIFTNICNDEKPLPGTEGINAKLCEMKSLLEKAGTFIGIRSGLCDVIRTVACKKIALYPDYNYSDTKWKAIDMYAIDGFENIVVRTGDTWKELKKKMKL